MSSTHADSSPSPPPPGKRMKMMTEEEYNRLIQAQAERDAAVAEKNKLIAERESLSLRSVIPGSNVEAPFPHLTPRGLPSSFKARGRKRNVTASKKDFHVPDLQLLVNRLGLGLELSRTPSRLRNLLVSRGGVLMYQKEYDVQFIVQHALEDAVEICNMIINRKLDALNRPTPSRLCVYCESSLFSNVVDHAVVIDTLSGAPVFIVETKRKWNQTQCKQKNSGRTGITNHVAASETSPTSPPSRIWEQIYDQLSEMHAKGHPNPFGALTCFDETYITCLDTTACKEVLEILSTTGYEDSRLDQIVSNLVQTIATISTPDHRENVDTSSTGSTTKPEFHENEDCHVWHSVCFAPENMIAAFVSGIFCSLDGFQIRHYGIKSIEVGQQITVGALDMSEKSRFWGTLQTIYQGPKKLKGRIGPLYLVDHLGIGSTSKVYHALTLNGHECVVKIYVMRKDEDKNCILSEEEFMKNAKAAVKREYQAYKDIYGKELEGYVRMMKLNGLHCLILPYFKHVDKRQRKSLLSSTIRQRLKLFHNRRKNKFCAFHKSDQLWRHIGWFNGKLYLFDLGDLEDHELVKKNDLIDSHCKRLAARIEE
mmetsp:Transcript_13819/g.26021  ORF Transcript_13819/g.26021 Transcript_13819/m.26021 type:complete len:595 (-) Transcript_13819:292-2076(-)